MLNAFCTCHIKCIFYSSHIIALLRFCFVIHMPATGSNITIDGGPSFNLSYQRKPFLLSFQITQLIPRRRRQPFSLLPFPQSPFLLRPTSKPPDSSPGPDQSRPPPRLHSHQTSKVPNQYSLRISVPFTEISAKSIKGKTMEP